ncbi:MAG: ASKHA domain-containing protein [Clostridia bacterium]|nr:ASKHA domain-containing protein [Clostridia bacterium]
MSYQVIFQPSGRRGQVPPGKSLLEAARELGVDIEAPCGSAGICGKCKVKIETGFFPKFGLESSLQHLSLLTEEEQQTLMEEEIAENYRLACLTKVWGDVLVFVPEESRAAKQVVLEEGTRRSITVNPAVRKYLIHLESRSLGDSRGDWELLRESLWREHNLPSEITVDYFVLRKLPIVLREEEGQVTVWVWQGREVIGVEPGHGEGLYGVAVDVGTTTVAAYLCNLETGKVEATKSLMNPQVRYGEDVLSRISYAGTNPDGLADLNKVIIEGINGVIAALAAEAGLIPQQIADVTLVFNTAMHHLALNLEPQFLGQSPFLPAVKEALDLKARELGINISPGGRVHVLPVEAGFVGPDNMAVIIAEEPYNSPHTKLIIDIGTNGEIVLGNQDFLASTSCATGPALEGAQITFGMRAAEGAIERVRIEPRTLEVEFRVIGSDLWSSESNSGKARGICGSGIIDAVAELFSSGIISASGRFNKDLPTNRLRKNAAGKTEFVLAWAEETAINQDIIITQGDVRAVQLAKAALYVGAKYLMEKFGVDEVHEVILAGAFGTYIDREKALIMGMFPDCPPENIRAVGNAAGDGAKLALLNIDKRNEAGEIAKKVKFLETTLEPDFQTRFAEAIAFPHAKDGFPNAQELLNKIKEESDDE